MFVSGWWAVAKIRELDHTLVDRLSGRRWNLPSRIYAESSVVYLGRSMLPAELAARLDRLGYQRADGEPKSKGTFRRVGEAVDVYLRDFDYPDRRSVGVPARISFRLGLVSAIDRLDGGEAIPSIELEPELVAGIYEGVWRDRRPMKVTEFPAMLVNAVLAAEDRRFFEHHGVDTRGVLRALLANFRSGRVVQGGSTLTQQVIKNIVLTPARTVRRKVKEAVMALLLERRYPKLEILELYLNEIYLGQRGAMGVHGVVEGARFYFGKEPSDLTLGETASLAGLIRSPGRYAPTRDPARAQARRKQVLRVLLEDHKIDQAEFDAAVAEPLPERLPSPEPALAPYFVDYARTELEGRFEQEDLVSQGFRIFTTLDAPLQAAAAAAVESGLARLEKAHPEWAKRPSSERLQAALVALEPSTGEIRAMVGGRSYAESQFNRATQARRQVGSIFKPVVALAAFEDDERTGGRRFPPTRHVDDAPFEWRYEGQSWTPSNFDKRYFGETTLRIALEQSLNSATARIAQEVGLSRIRELATRLGFPVVTPVVPSLVLGAIDATPLEVAQAYAAIASLGFRSETMSIRSVLDAEREPLERATLSAAQVVSPRVAHLATTLLEGVVDRGTARAIRAAGIQAPVAGKTGTTNDGRDAWFAGFTPDLVAVVWVGFDHGDAAGLTGSQGALPIWIDFMKEVLADRSTVPFLVPPGIQSVDVDPATGGLATPLCPARIRESFLAGEEPVAPCPLHPSAPDPLAASTPVASPPGVALSR